MSDMRVKVSPTGMHTYPDVVAVCGESTFEGKQVDTLTNPTVIIEVLSPSIEAYDPGAKFANYRKLDSLIEYVLVSQSKAQVEHYARYGDGGDQWILTDVAGHDGVLRLASIDCHVALSDMYDKVSFPEGDMGIPNPLD